MSLTDNSALLLLENGREFRGDGFGREGIALGEAVFNTAMSGYQEVLSDPSYSKQIVVMTAVHIGNTGCNPEDYESRGTFLSAMVMRRRSRCVSSWRSTQSLDEFFCDHGIVGLEGIDTRALTRELRSKGAMRACIGHGQVSVDEMKQQLAELPPMQGSNLVPGVSSDAAYEWTERPWIAKGAPKRVAPAKPSKPSKPASFRVIAYDFGIKYNILRELVAAGCEVEVVSANTPASVVLDRKPDGVFLSNGPGDPDAVEGCVSEIESLLESGVPIFGICLGHQLLARALGATCFKLPFGHHGANHPVKDLKTGKVEITSQNHGFAIDPQSLGEGKFGKAEVSHLSLYDESVEGIQLVGKPVFSVQYHPEACPGPNDAHYLFARFIDHMSARKNA